MPGQCAQWLHNLLLELLELAHELLVLLICAFLRGTMKVDHILNPVSQGLNETAMLIDLRRVVLQSLLDYLLLWTPWDPLKALRWRRRACRGPTRRRRQGIGRHGSGTRRSASHV